MIIGVAILLAVLPARGATPSLPKAADPNQKLLEAGRYAEVIAALPPQKMEKLRGNDLRRATLYLATAYSRTGRLDKALSLYQLGTKLYPKDVELLLGQAQLFHASRMEEAALPLYHRILKLESNYTQAHLGLAAIDRALGFLDRSAQHYETALEDLKDDAGLWRDYAEVLLEQRDFKTAELAIEKSLALEFSTRTVVVRAFIQRESGDLPRAIASLNQALALSGQDVRLVLVRALWLLEAGQFNEAKNEASSALKNDPSSALALWIRARARVQEGAADLAAQDFAKAHTADPDSFVGRSAAALLKELKRRK